MKKRMFITTIVMMLVLAVALTTSSLAWFSSSNTTVTANAATFTAATASSSSVNLKISDTEGGWANQISLTSGGRTMSALIPTEALITKAAVGEAITTTGVTINGVATAVTHQGYVWPARMTFNSAKIGSESNFVIDDSANEVETYGNTARNASTNYYYDYFYIHNAGSQNVINSLTFKLDSTLSTIASGTTGYNEGDYTARGYAAFIVFDKVKYAVGDIIPDNAFTNPGKTVVASDTAAPADDEIAEASADAGVLDWIPFAAFTIATKKGNSDTYQHTAWQFADLDAKVGDVYTYNNALISSLPTQAYDALSGTGNDDGFLLNSTSLKALNNKVIDSSGNVAATIRGEEEGKDASSTFIMQPGEIFMVAMYYWLDGQSLTEFTDTTVSTIGVQISAAQ